MPGTLLPPDHAASIGRLAARVERVERTTTTPVIRPVIPMIFSYAGTILNNQESPPWYPRRSGAIVAVRLSLSSAATGTTTVAVRVTGTEKQRFSISSGLTVYTVTGIAVEPGDYVTVMTVAVNGTDANLSVDIDLA